MAISRKPKPDLGLLVDVDALIAKGGSVAQSSSTESSEASTKVTSFTLRVPAELLGQLDAQRKGKLYRVPRQQWILEAIAQRLERESSTQ